MNHGTNSSKCAARSPRIKTPTPPQRDSYCHTDRDSDDDPTEEIIEQQAKTEPGPDSRPNAHRQAAIRSPGLVTHV